MKPPTTRLLSFQEASLPHNAPLGSYDFSNAYNQRPRSKLAALLIYCNTDYWCFASLWFLLLADLSYKTHTTRTRVSLLWTVGCISISRSSTTSGGGTERSSRWHHGRWGGPMHSLNRVGVLHLYYLSFQFCRTTRACQHDSVVEKVKHEKVKHMSFDT